MYAPLSQRDDQRARGVRVPGAALLVADEHRDVQADERAVLDGRGARLGRHDRHRPRVHLALRRRVLRQRGHRHLLHATHILSVVRGQNSIKN